MRLTIAVLVLTLGMIAPGFEAIRPDTSSPEDRIVKDKPTVYLTFEREGKRNVEHSCRGESTEGIWLRLHNNLRSPIAVRANYLIDQIKPFKISLRDGNLVDAIPDGSEVELCYQAEGGWSHESLVTRDARGNTSITMDIPVEKNPPKQLPGCSCRYLDRSLNRTESWIRPGESVIFSLPKEYVSNEYLKVYTSVAYEFEITNGKIDRLEPLHHVYFRY